MNARDVSGETPLDELTPREYLPGKYLEEKEGEIEAIIGLFRKYHPDLDADTYREKHRSKKNTP